ncbi:MAG: hypothetical protein QOH82_4502 [Mycobacterium sp.]|nr:hypothetical protein [Mycobacterium sp.]
MTEPRPRNAAQTRADILSAARRRFATEGFQRTTLRAVAADVGVDQALVSRYFGSKQDLFATATEFKIDLPDLSEADPDDIAGMLLLRCGRTITRSRHCCGPRAPARSPPTL